MDARDRAGSLKWQLDRWRNKLKAAVEKTKDVRRTAKNALSLQAEVTRLENLLSEASIEPTRLSGAALLARASRSAKRQVVLEDGGKADLWDHVAAQPRLAKQALELPACAGKRTRKKRTASLDLHWLLLTTDGLAEGESAAGGTAADRAETAKDVIGWYVRRWTIELFFKSMKSSTRIKDRRLDHADDLRKCLVFDVVTACHVFDLERLAREAPGTPAADVVDPEEINVLHALLREQGHPCARGPPRSPPRPWSP